MIVNFMIVNFMIVTYKNVIYIIISIFILLTGTVQADYMTSLHASHGTYKGFDNKEDTLVPINQTSNFTTSDKMVVSWLYLEDMNIGDELKWDWYDRDDNLYREDIHKVNWSGSGWAYSHYLIESLKPGTWKVVISYNNNIEATDTFYIQNSLSYTPTMTTTPTYDPTTIIDVTAPIDTPKDTENTKKDAYPSYFGIYIFFWFAVTLALILALILIKK